MAPRGSMGRSPGDLLLGDAAAWEKCHNGTMVLMTAGDELHPVFDSLAPVIALTRRMPLASMAKCIKAAQNEQRDTVRT